MCTIVGELDKCVASNDPLLVNIGKSMRAKFDKYWLQLDDLNKILIVAVVLDPRYKVLYLDFFFLKLLAAKYKSNMKEVAQKRIDEVVQTLISLFNFYTDNDPVAAATSKNVTMSMVESRQQEVDEDSQTANLHMFKLLR
ncbi:hypothetical protein ACLB2K_072561 [Fragaria x ananassa]